MSEQVAKILAFIPRNARRIDNFVSFRLHDELCRLEDRTTANRFSEQDGKRLQKLAWQARVLAEAPAYMELEERRSEMIAERPWLIALSRNDEGEQVSAELKLEADARSQEPDNKPKVFEFTELEKRIVVFIHWATEFYSGVMDAKALFLPRTIGLLTGIPIGALTTVKYATTALQLSGGEFFAALGAAALGVYLAVDRIRKKVSEQEMQVGLQVAGMPPRFFFGHTRGGAQMVLEDADELQKEVQQEQTAQISKE